MKKEKERGISGGEMKGGRNGIGKRDGTWKGKEM